MKKPQYRAVQIDLARQIETVETVKAYFDQAAEAGMNMVVLYLEDRIRTATYPYPAEGEAYSEDQIRELVAYADARGLELVPVVSPVGHTERFLAHPELEHMAELRGNIAGRFTEAGHSKPYFEACPMLDETKQFMERYMTEVAALFPSEFFHIGFDEIFNMGVCELCKPVMEREGIDGLFRDILLYFYRILKNLGKTVMIWDDMLEHCRDSVIDEIPRDIVMCAWFYRFYQRFPEARFTTSRRYDLFKKFDRLGFSYFACSNIQIKSIDTVTDYARKYEPMGMLMTVWELATQPNTITELPLRYAGLLWNTGAHTGYETLVRAAEQFTSTPDVARAVAAAATHDMVNRYNIAVPQADQMELNRFGLMKQNSAAAVLEQQLRGVENTDNDCVQCYYASVLHYRFSYILRSIAYDLFQYRVGETALDKDELSARLAEARARLAQMVTLNRATWESSRHGIASPKMDSFLAECENSLSALETLSKTAKAGEIGRLDVHFSLPEYTAACITKLTLLYADGSTYEVANGTYKADREVYFDRVFAIPADKVPCALNLEVSGYGASGFCYADVTLPEIGRLIPAAVTRAYGQVEHPEYMLIDDFTSTICGDPEMLRTVHLPQMAKLPHGFTVALEKE